MGLAKLACRCCCCGVAKSSWVAYVVVADVAITIAEITEGVTK